MNWKDAIDLYVRYTSYLLAEEAIKSFINILEMARDGKLDLYHNSQVDVVINRYKEILNEIHK